jgi:hypothetical protein
MQTWRWDNDFSCKFAPLRELDRNIASLGFSPIHYFPRTERLIFNNDSLSRTFSLVCTFSLAVAATVAVSVVALDLDAEHFLCRKCPKCLGAVPSLRSVRERIVGNIVVVRVEGVRPSPRVACTAVRCEVQRGGSNRMNRSTYRQLFLKFPLTKRSGAPSCLRLAVWNG